jgi:hypothetical protein
MTTKNTKIKNASYQDDLKNEDDQNRFILETLQGWKNDTQRFWGLELPPLRITNFMLSPSLVKGFKLTCSFEVRDPGAEEEDGIVKSFYGDSLYVCVRAAVAFIREYDTRKYGTNKGES